MTEAGRGFGQNDMMGFYLRDEGAEKGVSVILLAERKWPPFLKMRAGFTAPAFFSRPRRACEPETHANGHPWAWIYKPADVLKDEVRWLDPGEYEKLKNALAGALHDASLRREAAGRQDSNPLALAA